MEVVSAIPTLEDTLLDAISRGAWLVVKVCLELGTKNWREGLRLAIRLGEERIVNLILEDNRTMNDMDWAVAIACGRSNLVQRSNHECI